MQPLTKFKGPVMASLGSYRPSSLAAGYARAIGIFGDRIPETLLEEWVQEWWNKQLAPDSSPKKRKVAPEREVTLSELKVADDLDFLIRQLELSTNDVRKLTDAVVALGGIDSAMRVVEELKKLRSKRPSIEPSLFDDTGLSALEDGCIDGAIGTVMR
jgi:hypothetical protein